MKRNSSSRPTRATVTAPAPATGASTSPVRDEFHQGKAHVSNPAKVERSADDAAAGRGGKPAPEGNTPGGVSS